MAFQVSPGVNISEIDLTTIVPAVATALGGIAGNFEWGPSKKVVLVNSPKMFRETFGEVKNWNYNEWFSATNFLGYSSALQVVRVVGGPFYGGVTAANAHNGMTTDSQLIHNEDLRTPSNRGVIARYPGQKGDSLMVTVFAGAGATDGGSAGFTAWKSSSTNYYAFFGLEGEGAPESTENIQTLEGGVTTNDQMHLLVIDEDGFFTGAKDTILERFENLSVFPQARFENGETRFYKRYINENSKYIYIGGSDTPSNARQDLQDQLGITFSVTGANGLIVNWGATNNDGTTYRPAGFTSQSLLGGAGQTSTAFVVAYPAQDPNGYNLFEDVESYDVNLMIAGAITGQQAGFIKSIVEARRDCMAFFSAENKNEFDLETNKVTKCLDIKSDVGSSSYVVIDSGYKYQYDPYNDLYRWIPLNADTAGLVARTEATLDAWWSPAGFNRGQVRNVVKLGFNPAKAFRDAIYPDGINPVITVPGEGTILFGDKTALSRPSAFDRINVRRLFIVLQKAIATASKFSLFEFNDAITRGRFVNLVTPFLEDVRTRRGVIDFKVVCDESNNTPERIDRNEFWADIYIKPNRSINFIQLNFVATRTDSSFDELGA